MADIDIHMEKSYILSVLTVLIQMKSIFYKTKRIYLQIFYKIRITFIKF